MTAIATNKHPINGRAIMLVSNKHDDDGVSNSGCRDCIGDGRPGGEGICGMLASCTTPDSGVWKYEPELLTEDPDHGDPAVSLDTGENEALAYKPVHGGYPQGPAMPLASDSHSRANDTLVAALARTTDPEPSHTAAASVGGGKLVDLILTVMGESKLQRARVNAEEYGYTGKELSQTLGKPLNSITPRLAPMRRAGYIHADGTRNRETVWKLGNGVKA